jgi:hypothetical protein
LVAFELDETSSILDPKEGEEKDRQSLPQILEGENFLEEDSLAIFHVENIGRKYGEPTNFFITLQINGFLPQNCVLDSNPSTNIIPRRVMQKLGLDISQPYKKECDMEPNPIKVCGLTKSTIWL